jgi:prolyl 4-hydroxylase
MATTADNYRARIGAWVKARLMRDPKALKIDCEGLDLFVVRDVLSPAQCRALIELLDEYMAPSTIMAPHPDPEYRTSYSGNPPWDHPLIQELENSIHGVMGIQRELGEAVQGQRYTVGQQFKPHWDFLIPGEPYWAEQVHCGGQRTWTAMMFLNEPEAGGHTTFTDAGVSIRPRGGNLLVWNNLTPEGDPNPLSKHQGSPVEAGVKYVITKWYRERPWMPRPEGPADY